MLKRLALPILGLSLLLLTSHAQAQTFTYTVDADNDMALYVGNADASIFRLVVDKSTAWNQAASGTFTLNLGEDYFYMLSLNYGEIGDIGGILNNVSIVDMPNWVSKDVTGKITGFPSAEDPTFSPNTEEVRSLITAGGFASVAPPVGWGASSNILGTTVFMTPEGETATLYRQAVTAAGVSAAPEPGSVALLMTAGVPIAGLVRRRKKQR